MAAITSITENWNNHSFKEVENHIKEYYPKKIVEVSWAQLKGMRDESTLTPGQWYRITDYTTTTTQANTQSAGHQFDIIVRADSIKKINENAYAALHSGDTYFTNAGAKLEAWELKYCIDNDTNRFSWAKTSGGKGVIYWMRDEWGNECPYDFKNIQFKRYKLKNKNYLHYADYPMDDMDYSDIVQKAFNVLKDFMGTSVTDHNIALYYTRGMFVNKNVVSGAEIYNWSSDYESYDGGNLTFNDGSGGNYVSMLSCCDEFDIIAEVENTNGEWFYTFSKKASANAAATDASFESHCHHNIIKENDNLNDNVFMTLGSYLICSNNSIGKSSNKNSIGNDFKNNSIGDGCYNNSIGWSCNDNSIGNGFHSNSIGNSFHSNSIADSFEGNSIGNYCSSNSMGVSFYYNSIGNNCIYNSIGNDCYNNSIGNYFSSNSIGSDFCYNSIADSFEGNSIGSECSYISTPNDFKYNSIGNKCNYIYIYKGFVKYIIIENGNENLELTSTQTTSYSNQLRNIKICQGVNNTSTLKTIYHNSVNDTFLTEYKPTGSRITNV